MSKSPWHFLIIIKMLYIQFFFLSSGCCRKNVDLHPRIPFPAQLKGWNIAGKKSFTSWKLREHYTNVSFCCYLMTKSPTQSTKVGARGWMSRCNNFIMSHVGRSTKGNLKPSTSRLLQHPYEKILNRCSMNVRFYFART